MSEPETTLFASLLDAVPGARPIGVFGLDPGGSGCVALDVTVCDDPRVWASLIAVLVSHVAGALHAADGRYDRELLEALICDDVVRELRGPTDRTTTARAPVWRGK